MSEITTIQADGLHLSGAATLAQLPTNEIVTEFAEGMLLKALAQLSELEMTLTAALHTSTSEMTPLLTALLTLDAEIKTVLDDKTRTFPLPVFLSYRASMPPERIPINTVRLPPLNPDGHYFFEPISDGSYLALRLDLHPTLRVMGHVRLAYSRDDGPPARFEAAEYRLERSVLTPEVIDEAIARGPLSDAQQAAVVRLLRGLLD